MLKGRDLSNLLAEKAQNAYYVGGCLLDSFLGKYSGDIDLALPRKDVKQTAKNLGLALNASVFEMDPEFCVWRLTTKEGFQIDLSALEGDNILKDLPRRDFTINALALPTSSKPTLKLKTENGKTKVLFADINEDSLIDLNDGKKAIKNKKIIANNANVFDADPLRLFRAFRIAAEREFEIDKNTLALIKANANKANKPSGERIQEELKRLMRAHNTAHYLQVMEDLGLFKKLLPTLADQKDCAECYYGKGGVWKHTLLVVERIEFLLNNLKLCIPEFYKELEPYCQDHALYKMAALLHDIAKPETAKMKDGRLRFFYHEQQGAKRAECFLNDLRYSSSERRLICKMISSHLRPSNLASNEIVTNRGVYKFFKELGPAGIPLLFLCWADYTSYVSMDSLKTMLPKAQNPVITIEEGKALGAEGKTLRHLQMLNLLFTKFFKESQKIILPEKLLDGKDIMNHLKLPSGKIIGIILEHLAEAQVEGKFTNKDEALAYLLKHKQELLSLGDKDEKHIKKP